MKKHNWILIFITILIILVSWVLILTACTVSVVTPTPPMPLQPQGQIQGVPQPLQGQQPALPAPPGNNANGPSSSGTVLVDRMVVIPTGGGNAELSFTASSGQRLQIVLAASNAGMQPYGNLQSPDGSSQYNPPIDTAAKGANRAEVSLNQGGQFSLTVFDGSNQGGSVSVIVAVLK